ncbi:MULTISPECIES: hypothetical protein [unclassified Methylobacterium]|jgi:hypothetical protein|uniref:hypothetical protein n=1 Tax=unclassified Methylobacterium TaxID=2615210 RepID=UPI0005BA5C2F|nr:MULTISPECIES: hypothetical protein [unclassified Methylobacterium]SFU94198.1 hypothetical protein SAMN02799643_03308 [Methylobacterium sp. UNCCL125]
MGTNYFAVRDGTEANAVQHHIGKSSAGWPFCFRAYGDLGVHDWPTWRRYLSRPGIRIVSEYRDQLTVEGLEYRVTGAREHWQAVQVEDAMKDPDLRLTLCADTHNLPTTRIT